MARKLSSCNFYGPIPAPSTPPAPFYVSAPPPFPATITNNNILWDYLDKLFKEATPVGGVAIW